MHSHTTILAKTLLLTFLCPAFVRLSAQGDPYPIKRLLAKPSTLLSSGATGSDALSADGPLALTSDQQSATDDIKSTLGRGYNSSTQQLKGICVNGAMVGDRATASAPSYKIEIIKSYDQFRSAVSAEANLSASFSAFMVTLKSKFDSASKSQKTRQFLLLRERVLVPPSVSLRGARLAVEPPDASVPASVAQFYSRCGDSYISQIEMGGEFISLFSYDQRKEDLKSELETDASASGWGTSASVHLESTMNALRQASGLEIMRTQIGGNTSLLPELTLDGQVAYTRQFPGQIEADAAAPVGIVKRPYRDLGIGGDHF